MQNADHKTDELLMAAFQRNMDEAAFEKLVRRFTPSALSVAQSMLSNRVLAEDAVQEAFVAIIRKKDKFDSSKSFGGWFFTILKNICKDFLRKDRRHKAALWQASMQSQSHSTDSYDMEWLSILQSLDEKYKSVILLRIVHSMPFSLIAQSLAISEEAAKKRAQRGLAELRRHYTTENHITRQAV